jgi:hypothetical protein
MAAGPQALGGLAVSAVHTTTADYLLPALIVPIVPQGNIHLPAALGVLMMGMIRRTGQAP